MFFYFMLKVLFVLEIFSFLNFHNMNEKAFFMIFKWLSLKQIKTILEGENPTLRNQDFI